MTACEHDYSLLVKSAPKSPAPAPVHLLSDNNEGPLRYMGTQVSSSALSCHLNQD